jgi:hypothetical protein
LGHETFLAVDHGRLPVAEIGHDRRGERRRRGIYRVQGA